MLSRPRAWGRPTSVLLRAGQKFPRLAFFPNGSLDAAPSSPTSNDSARRLAQLEAENGALRAELTQSSQQFAQALEHAKLEALKELAYGASHEINNPLANIAGRAQTLLKRTHDPETRKALEAIQRQALRAHEMIADLMLFARPPALRTEDFLLRPVLERILDERRALALERGITLTLETPEDLRATGDPTQLAVAIRALVENSLEAIGQQGELAVRARLAKNGGCEIEVRDTGPGVSPAVREHLFDPFYSGREAGRGLGFGLSKCWRIVTAHGGEVRVGDGPGGVFTVWVPRLSEP